MKLFFYYFLISGFIMVAWFFYEFNFSKSKEESDEAVADMTWQTGVKRENIRNLLYVMAFCLGWIMLPWEFIDKFVEITSGKGEE